MSEKEKAKKVEMVDIEPIRDFDTNFNKLYQIKKGEKISVPKILLQNLKTEKVIK